LSRQVYTGYGSYSRLLISKIVDEFYSGYLYTHGCNGETVSSAKYIDGMSLISYCRVLMSIDVDEVLTPSGKELSLLGSCDYRQRFDQDFPASRISYLLGNWSKGMNWEIWKESANVPRIW